MGGPNGSRDFADEQVGRRIGAHPSYRRKHAHRTQSKYTADMRGATPSVSHRRNCGDGDFWQAGRIRAILAEAAPPVRPANGGFRYTLAVISATFSRSARISTTHPSRKKRRMRSKSRPLSTRPEFGGRTGPSHPPPAHIPPPPTHAAPIPPPTIRSAEARSVHPHPRRGRPKPPMAGANRKRNDPDGKQPSSARKLKLTSPMRQRTNAERDQKS